MQEAVIVDCVRTPVGKAPRGTLRNVRPDDMAVAVIRHLLEKHPQVPKDEIGDVILGCAYPEAEAGLNMARNVALMAGLPDEVPGMTINRFCASGLQAIAIAAERIRAGAEQIVLAGGAESMSLTPRGGNNFSPNTGLVDCRPEVYMNMGLTAENVQRKYRISREDQDAYSFLSHEKAVRAQAGGVFEDELVHLELENRTFNAGRTAVENFVFERDEGPRPDTSIEALSRLKPVFHAHGTVTAGNSSQQSDGAAVALVMAEKKARELRLRPLARFVSFAVAGVPPDIMGIGPVVAIPKALAMAGLELDDVDLIELNEAFAVQALAVIRLAGLDPDRVNVNGGAIALGHPLGCTGAKLTATLLRDLRRRAVLYGMVTMCVAGGQGAAGIFERM